MRKSAQDPSTAAEHCSFMFVSIFQDEATFVENRFINNELHCPNGPGTRFAFLVRIGKFRLLTPQSDKT
ncbi:hypothetical protein SCOR_25190 [Sulfidibacter corallicola]